MRILTTHQKPLEILTTEAVKVLDLSRGPPESDLNGKNEWAGSNVPDLLVQKLKGTSGGARREGETGTKMTKVRGDPEEGSETKLEGTEEGEEKKMKEKEPKELRREDKAPRMTQPTITKSFKDLAEGRR